MLHCLYPHICRLSGRGELDSDHFETIPLQIPGRLYLYEALKMSSHVLLSKLSQDNAKTLSKVPYTGSHCEISFAVDLLDLPTWAHLWRDARGQVTVALATDDRG